MSYQVVFKTAAQRQFKKLPPKVQQDLLLLIEGLSAEPRPLGCKKLKGRQNQYRIRLGYYRIEDTALIVRVIKVGHRRDIYEG